jgi:hypothetical protein
LNDWNYRTCDRRLCGRRSYAWSRSRPTTLLQQKHNGIALFRIQTAQLIFNVDARLTAHVDEIFTLDVELSRQGINTGFLLQAELLYSDLPRPPVFRTKKLQYRLF